MERYTRSYLQLIKPGITLSNTIAAAAGYFLAASIFGFSLSVMLAVLGGVALVIASACVVNNMLDRGRDKHMKRTKGREIAAGHIPLTSAGLYAFVLGVVGFELLIGWTNMLTFQLGVIAYVWYVVIYGIAKRTTPLSTIIGAVPGALPPVAGYTALSGHLDPVAWTLFGLMMVWQLPHFYAISIFRRDDYKRARLPVWSVRYGTGSTKAQIFFWVIVFLLLAPLLTVFHATGVSYVVIMAALSIFWVTKGATSYRKLDDEKWAKQMFGISLLVLLVMCGSIALGGYLP